MLCCRTSFALLNLWLTYLVPDTIEYTTSETSATRMPIALQHTPFQYVLTQFLTVTPWRSWRRRRGCARTRWWRQSPWQREVVDGHLLDERRRRVQRHRDDPEQQRAEEQLGGVEPQRHQRCIDLVFGSSLIVRWHHSWLFGADCIYFIINIPRSILTINLVCFFFTNIPSFIV